MYQYTINAIAYRVTSSSTIPGVRSLVVYVRTVRVDVHVLTLSFANAKFSSFLHRRCRFRCLPDDVVVAVACNGVVVVAVVTDGLPVVVVLLFQLHAPILRNSIGHLECVL